MRCRTGASGWTYFVPYQPDIQRALDTLRAEEFEVAKDYPPTPWWRTADFEETLPPPGELDDDEIAALRAEYDRLRALPEPTTIDEYLVWCGEEGAHSILDVRRIVETPAPPRWHPGAPFRSLEEIMRWIGTVSPLAEAQLLQLFGTLRPTRAMVEQQTLAISELRERSEGVYVVVYRGDEPAEICFTGFSGD